jgi:hypothetical protein
MIDEYQIHHKNHKRTDGHRKMNLCGLCNFVIFVVNPLTKNAIPQQCNMN